MSEILITGATGQIGHAIARRLVSNGLSPRALVRSPERAACLPEGVRPVRGDLLDPESLRPALAGCTVVYHAAGLPEQWRKDVDDFQRVNVDGTRNVVAAALEAGVERFVYTSTIDVLEQSAGIGFAEPRISTGTCVTPYQRSKQEADRLVTAACEVHGLPAVFLHPAGFYGPAPFLVTGLNQVLAGLAKGEIPMLLPGGMPVVYSDDVADGHVRAAEHAPVGGRYILAESFQTLADIARGVSSHLALAKIPRVMPLGFARAVSFAGEGMARVTGKPPMIARGVLDFLAMDPRPSSEQARAALGWSPRPFSTGLEHTLEHFEAQGWVRR